MKFLVFSDLHLHPYRMFASYASGDNSRREEILIRLRDIIEKANAGPYDAILMAGDFFHEKLKVDVVSVAKSKALVATSKKPIIACSGTHDITFSGHSSLSVFSTDERSEERSGSVRRLDVSNPNYRGLFVFDESVLLTKYNEACLVVAVPSVSSSGQMQAIESALSEALKEALKIVGKRQIRKVLLTHADVIGTSYGRHIVDVGIDADILAEMFDVAIIGHIHHPYESSSRGFVLLQPGAAIPHSFSDEGTDIGGGNVWEVRLSSSGIYTSQIHFHHPAFRTIRLGSEASPEELDPADYYRIISPDRSARFPALRHIMIYTEPLQDFVPRTEAKVRDSISDLIETYLEFACRIDPQLKADRDWLRKLHTIGEAIATHYGDPDLLCDKLEEVFGNES